MRNDLLACLPVAATEAIMRAAMLDGDAPTHRYWPHLVNALRPRPWSAAFSRAYLAGLQAYVATMRDDMPPASFATDWPQTLYTAALSMPPACFTEAQFDLALPAGNALNQWQITHWRQQWQAIQQIIHLRQRIYAEIPLTE